MRPGLISLIWLIAISATASAEVRCDDPAVVAVVIDVFKCQELVTCAGDSWGGLKSAKAIEEASDETISREIDQGMKSTLILYERIGTPAAVDFGKSVVGATKKMVGTLRDLFPTISATTLATDYDPNRRRYTCQVTFRADEDKFQRYAGYQGLMMALANPTLMVLVQASLSEGKSPKTIVNNQARVNAVQFNCINRSRSYSLQPTVRQEFIVALDNQTFKPGCV